MNVPTIELTRRPRKDRFQKQPLDFGPDGKKELALLEKISQLAHKNLAKDVVIRTREGGWPKERLTLTTRGEFLLDLWNEREREWYDHSGGYAEFAQRFAIPLACLKEIKRRLERR